MALKYVLFDLDGTLLEHGALTRKAVKTLKALKRNNVLVVIATGRHRGTVPLRLQSPRLVDYLICSNGAVVAPPRGEPLLEKTLSPMELLMIRNLGRIQGCRFAMSRGRSTLLSKAEPLLRRKTDGGSDTKKYFWRYYMYPLHSHMVESWDDYLRAPDARAEKVICTAPDQDAESLFCTTLEREERFTITGSNQAKEVTAGYECGMTVAGYNDIKEYDIFECFAMQEVKR